MDQPIPSYKAQALEAYRNVAHGFFGRQGGVSQGDFDSLNVSFEVGDPSQNITENRRRIVRTFDLHDPRPLFTLKQEHGIEVVTIHAKNLKQSRAFEGENCGLGDGIVTNIPGILLGIQTADCAPILMTDPQAGVVGALHAGWRSAFRGIVHHGIKAMVSLGAKPSAIQVVIGPTIGFKSYEVDGVFYQNFIKQDVGNGTFFSDPYGDEKRYFDLRSYVVKKISDEGIAKVDHIHVDTFTENDRVFSCRHAAADGRPGSFGRNLSVIGLC